MILTLLRICKTFFETPRICTFASVPVEINGIGATNTTSGVTSGPSEDRAIPGASCSILTASMPTPPVISDVAPARITMALSTEPEDTSVALNPRASESIATNTPTGPAIPRTATIAEVQRAFTLRKLEITGIPTLDSPQRIHDTQAHGPNARQQTAGHADENGKSQPHREH